MAVMMMVIPAKTIVQMHERSAGDGSGLVCDVSRLRWQCKCGDEGEDKHCPYAGGSAADVEWRVHKVVH